MKLEKNEIVRTGGNGRRSSCVAYNGVLYISGITTVLLEADTAGQADNIFEQLDKLMAYNGTDKSRMLSATVWLADIADYGDFNHAWDSWVVEGSEPARSVVEADLSIPEYRLKVSLIVALNR